MTVNDIIIYIMILFSLVGAADWIIGKRFGLGEKFEEGIATLGPLTMATAGILVLTPVLGDILSPVVVPFFRALGLDPAMFAGMLMDLDVGGAPLAGELADSEEGLILGGYITSSMLGATILFNIPVGLGIIDKEYRNDFALGTLIGMITIPFGVIAGGLAGGVGLPFTLINTIPVTVLSIIICICIMKWERAIIRVFTAMGKAVLAINVFGIGVGAIELFTKFRVFPETMPLTEVFIIIGRIAIILSGAFTLVALLTKLFGGPLERAGAKIGVNDISVAGFLLALTNSIPVYGTLKQMNKKGRIMNSAFAVSVAFVFGDHLGFMAGYAPDMIVPIVIGKLIGGITALILAAIICSRRRI